jgi:hypothetical protein
MALEPRTVTAEEEKNPELRDMRRRFWVALALTIPVVAIAMGHLFPGHPLQRLASSHFWGWVELGLATPVLLWCGWPFFVRGVQSVINRSLKMFTLIISTSELTADAAMVEQVSCLSNLHSYIGYKLFEFTGDRTLAGITIRKKGDAETLSLPVKGAFIAVGLEPNSSLAARQYLLNLRKAVCV